MIDKLRQIWPLAVSGIVGFVIAAILFLPQVYPCLLYTSDAADE